MKNVKNIMELLLDTKGPITDRVFEVQDDSSIKEISGFTGYIDPYHVPVMLHDKISCKALYETTFTFTKTVDNWSVGGPPTKEVLCESDDIGVTHAFDGIVSRDKAGFYIMPTSPIIVPIQILSGRAPLKNVGGFSRAKNYDFSASNLDLYRAVSFVLGREIVKILNIEIFDKRIKCEHRLIKTGKACLDEKFKQQLIFVVRPCEI